MGTSRPGSQDDVPSCLTGAGHVPKVIGNHWDSRSPVWVGLGLPPLLKVWPTRRSRAERGKRVRRAGGKAGCITGSRVSLDVSRPSLGLSFVVCMLRLS